MAKIGSLFVDLALNDASFISGLKRAQREQTTAMKSMAASANFLTGALQGVAIGVAGIFSAQSIRNALDFAGSIGEVSAALGVSQRDLQVYRFAATQANLSQEQIEKGLGKLTLEIGKGNAAFAELGIATKDAAGNLRETGTVLPELADALSKIESPAERARVLVELFGRSGQQLGPLLEGGAKGLRAFADEADRTGQVLSSDAIANADKAADSIAKFQNALKISVAGAVAANASAISGLSDSIAGLIARIGQLGAKASQISRTDSALAAARGDRQILGGLGSVRGKGLNSAAFIGKLLDQAIEDAPSARPAAAAAAAAAGGGVARRASFAPARQSPARAVESVAATLKLPTGADIETYFSEAARIATEQRDRTAALIAEGFKRDGLGADAIFGEDGLVSDDAFAAREARAESFVAKMEQAASLGRDISAGLAEGIIYGKNIGEALVNSFKAAAAEALANGLFKLLLGDGGRGGGVLDSILTVVGTAFGGARASGGPVSAGKSYLVGENGPERVTMGGNGYVTPNNRLGGNTTINVDARGATDPAIVRAAARQGALEAYAIAGNAARQSQRPRLSAGLG